MDRNLLLLTSGNARPDWLVEIHGWVAERVVDEVYSEAVPVGRREGRLAQRGIVGDTERKKEESVGRKEAEARDIGMLRGNREYKHKHCAIYRSRWHRA